MKRIAAGAICVVLSLTLLPSSLQAQPLGGPGALENGEIRDARGYAADNGVHLGEALRRLRIQDRIGRLNAHLEVEEEGSFAGLWVEHQPDFRIVVQFTDPFGGDRLAALLEHSPLASFVEVVEVEASLATLRAAQAAARHLVSQLGVLADSGIDYRSNRVHLYVLDGSDAETRVAASGLGLPDHVEIVEVPELSQVEADIYGGLAITTCTTGFSVQNGSGTKGVSTAAHCQNTQSYNGTNLPYQSGAYYDQYDVQWHTAPGLTVTDDIQTCSGCRRDISGTKSRSSQFVGEYVCKFGKTTGYTCGYISDKSYQSSSPASATATYIRVHRDGVDLSSGGDSGGPWFNANTAYGIHHSGIGDDATYMAINYISVLGVSVLTN